MKFIGLPAFFSPMKTCINHATLMKTPVDVFLKSIHDAGFEGVELRRDETFEYLKNHSVDDLKNLLTKNKLKVVTWNAIELFSLCSDKDFKYMYDYSERLMQIGNKIGCDTIIAVPSFKKDAVVPESKFFETTVSRFQILRQLTKKYNFKMGFEPLGFPDCSVRKIDLALKILNEAEKDGLPPSGLVIDTFHFFLGEHKSEDLKQIPKDKLWLIHFDDCVEKPIDLLQDADRVWPGLGYFDLKGFMNVAKSMGYNGYVSLELFNPSYWTMDPNKASEEAINSLKKYL